MHAQQAGQRICLVPMSTDTWESEAGDADIQEARCYHPAWAPGRHLLPTLGSYGLMTQVLEVDGTAATAQLSPSHVETIRTSGGEAYCSLGGVQWERPAPKHLSHPCQAHRLPCIADSAFPPTRPRTSICRNRSG